MVSPSSKRRAVKYVEEQGLGRKAQACRALGLVRSGAYRLPKQSQSSQVLQKQIVELSEDNPRYGYRRITILMRRKKQKVNFKRVQRIRRKEGFKVSGNRSAFVDSIDGTVSVVGCAYDSYDRILNQAARACWV